MSHPMKKSEAATKHNILKQKLLDVQERQIKLEGMMPPVVVKEVVTEEVPVVWTLQAQKT